MKKLSVNDINACMACRTCESACAAAFYKNEDTLTQNLSVIQLTGDAKTIKIKTCLQCGTCAKSCEAEAITQNNSGVFMLSRNKCNDCGKCIEACPEKLIVKAKERNAPTKCTACGICAKACPVEILYLQEA